MIPGCWNRSTIPADSRKLCVERRSKCPSHPTSYLLDGQVYAFAWRGDDELIACAEGPRAEGGGSSLKSWRFPQAGLERGAKALEIDYMDGIDLFKPRFHGPFASGPRSAASGQRITDPGVRRFHDPPKAGALERAHRAPRH